MTKNFKGVIFIKVGVSALSAGLGTMFPHIIDVAEKNYKQFLNLDLKLLPTVQMSFKEVWDNPKLRAEELNKAFLDDEILFINALIGGSDSIRILDYIDLSIANKIVMGFSDATSYLSYLAINGKKAYYGPSILAGIAQMHNFQKDYVNMIKEILFNDKNFEYKIFDTYSNNFVDWNKKDNNGALLDINKTKGPVVVNGEGVFRGKLWGGCMEVLEMHKQTKYFPSKEYLKEKIIFLETSEEKPSVDLVKRYLYNYCISGTFENISGILFGIFRDYKEEEKEKLYKDIKDVIVNEYGYDIPIICNLPFGHTSPTWILPYNEVLEIDINNKKFTLIRE